MYNVSIVICTKNIQKNNLYYLKSLKNFPVYIVDKNSNRKELDKIKKHKNIKLIKQKGNGLANARNLGLKQVKTKYLLMLGSDNILKDIRDIKKVIKYMKDNNWIGCGFLTRVYRKKTYFDICMDHWWKNKITEGQKFVVGTPLIYETKILKKFKYNEDCTHSDDTDLGERLKEKGYKQGYSGVIIYDVMENTYESIKDRWNRYSISDKEYHNQYCKTFKQKVKSYLHPFRTEWQGFKLWFLPFWILISFIRFKGRFK